MNKNHAWYFENEDYLGYCLWKKEDGTIVKVSTVFSTYDYSNHCIRSSEETYKMGCEWVEDKKNAKYQGVVVECVSKVDGLLSNIKWPTNDTYHYFC